jgi:acyl carrier protein
MTQREHLGTAVRTGVADQQGAHGRLLTPEESPRGETEVMVGSLFAEMLGLAELPRTASFFELGLDSVAVTVACARLEQLAGVKIRFSQLFRTNTVAGLAAWLDTAGDEADGQPGVPAEPSASGALELVAITPIQAGSVPQNIVVEIAWWFDGELDESALHSAATDVHRRHQALHARYLSGAEVGWAEVPVDPGRAEFHRLGSQDTDEAATEQLWRALRQPLRLAEGVVWRSAIVRSAESGRTLFGLVVDHVGFDGRSWDIMTAELAAAYEARAAGTSPWWPHRVASLAEMAADFRHQLAAVDAEVQSRYWRDELRDVPACHLPARKDGREPNLTPAPGSFWSPPGPAVAHPFTVSNEQLRPWNDYARATGQPPSVSMAAVYVQSIIRAGGTPDFAMMVPIANQAGDVIDRTIVNRVGNILLRPNGPARSGSHLLERMRSAYFEGMAARDILLPPKELQSLLGGESSDGIIHLDRMVALNYNSVPRLGLGGLDGTIAPGLGWSAKCMFTVMLTVVPGSEGLSMNALVRTDMCEDDVAGQIAGHFLDIVDDGPERLEQETAGRP